MVFPITDPVICATLKFSWGGKWLPLTQKSSMSHCKGTVTQTSCLAFHCKEKQATSYTDELLIAFHCKGKEIANQLLKL